MRSPAARAAVLIGAIAVAVVLFLVLRGGSDDASDSGTTATATTAGPAESQPLVITINEDGRVEGGVQKLSADKGDDIRFKIDSAVADEVHLHGYDIAKEVEAGGSVSFDVPATIEGVFEAELEERHEQILELTVNP